MMPYLKDTRQNLYSWMSARNKDGWKLFPEELREFYAPEDHEMSSVGKAPSKVKALTRLKSDLTALTVLFSGKEPYRIPARVGKNGWVGYGMGNASGDGFGAFFYIDGVLLFRYDQWTSSIFEASSNYRDLRNLFEALEKHDREEKLRDCEVFLLIDNLVVENDFYKGSSSSEILSNLVLRMRKVELEGGIILHMIYMSRKRMIASGVDALSREHTTKGVMKRNSLLTYFPFH